MHRPVAIGIPVFNGARWIRFTVASILAQTFTDLDVVILDNASTDGTADICADLCRQDTRIRYFRNETNIGVFRNFDSVFRLTRSRYFKWMSIGDSCDPSFIERAHDILERNNDVVLVHSRTGFLGDIPQDRARYCADLHLVNDDPVARFLQFLGTVRLNQPFHGLIRSAALAGTRGNRPFRNSDSCLMADLAMKGKFFEMPDEMLFRRMQIDTATALKSDDELKKFFAFEAVDPEILWRWKTGIGLLDVVLRAAIPASRKIALSPYFIKRLVWGHTELRRELVGHLRAR